MDETKYKICILFRYKIPQDRGRNAIMPQGLISARWPLRPCGMHKRVRLDKTLAIWALSGPVFKLRLLQSGLCWFTAHIGFYLQSFDRAQYNELNLKKPALKCQF